MRTLGGGATPDQVRLWNNSARVAGDRQVDERQIGLALALRELGGGSDLSGFDARLILQKSVYLLEAAGIRLGYSFNWYLRGPYSPDLTRDLFGLSASNEDFDDWVLDSRSQEVVQSLKPLIDGAPGEARDQKASRLELIASLHYLAQRGAVQFDDVEAAVEQLARNGKHFSAAAVAEAIESLKQVSLL